MSSCYQKLRREGGKRRKKGSKEEENKEKGRYHQPPKQLASPVIRDLEGLKVSHLGDIHVAIIS